MREPAIANLRRYIASPIPFVREVCGAEPDAWQLDVLGAAPTARRQAIVGSKGCGKTTVLAWLILWFLFTRPHANIAVTSISGDNLKDGLWKELARWLNGAPALAAAFEWLASRIVSRVDPANWFVSARQWSKSADTQQQSQTLAGFHAPYTMFVLDEAGSIPQAVAVTAEAALASGIECRLILAGNPTSLEGPLYSAAVTNRQHWHVVHVSGDPDDPKRSPRVDREWAQTQIGLYGRDNPWCRVNVLGAWPEASLNALLGVEEVEAAMHRHLREDVYTWQQKRLGVDVARYGDDRSVIFPRQGLAAFRPIVMRHGRGSAVSVDIATRVLAAKAKWGSELELFDATGGWAAGAVDVLRANGYAPIDVQFAAPAMDPRYKNQRAEIWFAMAEWIKRGAALPNLPELVGELTAPTFSFSGGKFVLEEKDQIKKRLGRSPDLADALALTFAMPEMPRGVADARSSIGHYETNWDPFAEAR
jgi:phage terminase large subunit